MPAERSKRTGGSGPTVDDRPSRDEVQRRINSLYDRAETATGNYNATRAMSGGPRKRVEPRSGASRPSDPTLDAVTRRLFDRARAQLGPTVPAVLPPSRTSAGPAAARSERRLDGEGSGRALEAQPGLAVAELTAGTSVPDITSQQLGSPVAELTARPVAELLPAAPQAPQVQTPQAPRAPQQPQPTVLDLPPVPAVEMAPAPFPQPQQFTSAFAPAPAFDPLTADLDLLPSIAAPRSEPAPARATWPPAESNWPTPETTWSTGQTAVIPEQQTWSTGQTPIVAAPETPWSSGQMPMVPEQQTWPTGQLPAMPQQEIWSSGEMPVVSQQQAASTGQTPVVARQQATSTGQFPVVPEQQPWATGQMPVVAAPEPTWSTGQTPVIPEQQTWSTGQTPIVAAPESPWSTGQTPMAPEQQAWPTGQMPAMPAMPAMPEQQLWSSDQLPLIPGQPTAHPAPQQDWRPPQQEWQPIPPAAEVSFAAAPLLTPEVSFAAAPLLAPEVTAAAAPAMAPEIILPTAPAMSPTVAAPVPVAPDAGTQSKTATALAFARAQIGRPCLWGAAGPDAYDCSSLTQAAWKAAGVHLPRTAQEQSSAGALVPLTDIRPGDLLFFHDSVDHVGLYTGNGLMIHAPSPGTPIREESIFYAGPAAIRGAVRPA
ncbi:NlpC/P60 family protein [Streptomyces sp. NPDC096057]|uniref:C40 family peptidase n=1 Tax=Streptomyces sp. NPDC096057 TaxID=3155543 RepID=UPI00331D96B5